MMAGNRIFWSSVGVCAWLAAGAATIVSSGEAHAEVEKSYTISTLTEKCRSFFEQKWRRVDMHAGFRCVSEMTSKLGRKDPRLIDIVSDVAETMGGARSVASFAVPLRQEADKLARDLYGDVSPQAGRTGLALVQSMILAGQCEVVNPVARQVLVRTRVAFLGLKQKDVRDNGLRRVALAFVDAKFTKEAVVTLLGSGINLNAFDYDRAAVWQISLQELGGAEQSLRKGLSTAEGRLRVRMLQRLRKLLFTQGDMKGLEALKNL